MTILLATAADTEAFGARLYRVHQQFKLVFLSGDLGVGKTTLVRGFLRAGAYQDAVKSPTFTLAEEYQMQDRKIVHFDLYRLTDPQELEWIGFSDYLDQDMLGFVEWPEMGAGYLPEPDLALSLKVTDQGHVLEVLKAPQTSSHGDLISWLQP